MLKLHARACAHICTRVCARVCTWGTGKLGTLLSRKDLVTVRLKELTQNEKQTKAPFKELSGQPPGSLRGPSGHPPAGPKDSTQGRDDGASEPVRVGRPARQPSAHTVRVREGSRSCVPAGSPNPQPPAALHQDAAGHAPNGARPRQATPRSHAPAAAAAAAAHPSRSCSVPARAPALGRPAALGRLGRAPPLRRHRAGPLRAGPNAGATPSPGRAAREVARGRRGRGRRATRSTVDPGSGGQARAIAGRAPSAEQGGAERGAGRAHCRAPPPAARAPLARQAWDPPCESGCAPFPGSVAPPPQGPPPGSASRPRAPLPQCPSPAPSPPGPRRDSGPPPGSQGSPRSLCAHLRSPGPYPRVSVPFPGVCATPGGARPCPEAALPPRALHAPQHRRSRARQVGSCPASGRLRPCRVLQGPGAVQAERLLQEEVPGQETLLYDFIKNSEMSGSSPFKMRLVHLDLKGAPPKVSYLSEVFPLFRALGANGLLLEYEDMFPYDGHLRLLRAKHAYSPPEIKEILHLASLNELEVIPLVQTFGHMEFVLKHEALAHLREVALFPNTLSPREAESLALVGAMVSQVLELHPDARWLHVGCDEVYYLGEGEASRRWLQQEHSTKARLCLSHIKAVACHVLARHPATRPLVWDDMLRAIPEDQLSASGVPQLVEPVLWDYGADLDVHGKALLMEKYRKCGFLRLWAASAFKGATGASQALTPIEHHLRNNVQWLQVAARGPPDTLQGIVLTGWQRYDHFSVLCELLPVGIPSLAVCLQSLLHGGFGEDVKAKVENFLGISNLETTDFTSEGAGSFPGSDILALVTHVSLHLRSSVDALLERDRYVSGWFSPYHRRRKLIHPVMVQHIQPQALSLLARWSALVQQLEAALHRVFYPDAVEEWLEENVQPSLRRLQTLLQDLREAAGASPRPHAAQDP